MFVFLFVMGSFSSSYFAVSSDFSPTAITHFYCHLRKRHKYSLVTGAGCVAVNTSQIYRHVHTWSNMWGMCVHLVPTCAPKLWATTSISARVLCVSGEASSPVQPHTMLLER